MSDDKTTPYEGYQEYPKTRYHAIKGELTVKDPDDEADRTPTEDGWVDSLADLTAK